MSVKQNTNWVVRICRRGLLSENGIEDMVHGGAGSGVIFSRRDELSIAYVEDMVRKLLWRGRWHETLLAKVVTRGGQNTIRSE